MSPPIPIEVRIGDGKTLRGHEFAPSGPPVVFLHEPGLDLDAWGPCTAEFAERGFKVLALDLAGHGLSDGEEGDWADSISEALGEIGSQWGPLGVIAAGPTCRPLLDIGADDGVPVQALVSPPPVDQESLRRSVPSMRLVMCGPDDREAHAAAKAVFDGVRGQRLMITGGGAHQGTELIANNPHLGDDLVMWFRRYLTAHHLAWIKQITSRPRSS